MYNNPGIIRFMCSLVFLFYKAIISWDFIISFNTIKSRILSDGNIISEPVVYNELTLVCHESDVTESCAEHDSTTCF